MILKVENLVKRYDDLLALDHFNLEIEKGEIFGLLGPNGSGKTTAINSILSLLSYDKGSINIFGKPMSPNAYDIKQKIGVVMQNIAVFEELTVLENIRFFCGLYIKDKKKCADYVEEAIAFVALEDFKKFLPKKLSGGLLRRLNIACGIAHKPELIFLDEPTVAVDPQSRNNILEGIVKLNQAGATIIYTTHYMEEVEQICSRIGIMDHGKIIASGTNDSLKSLILAGETISIEAFNLKESVLKKLAGLDDLIIHNYINQTLVLKYKGKNQHLIPLLQFLEANEVSIGRVDTQTPTLNDVFLEITGKELRD